ncbi:Tm-1-like ATP-binding domain-containing protein [Spirillospora sp. NPDC029432]|uniref:Tm-1-like ATP-binding domain-containing protein n=1 Tax=Spirillospora sp. NPDC029432 TaxID=3154599 RepID=UPI003454C561
MPVVVLIGMLDAQGPEYAWIRDRLEAAGTEVMLVDTGTQGPPGATPDITREEVALAAGADLDGTGPEDDRIRTMARGAAEITGRLLRAGRLHGVLAIGGPGSAVPTTAMRALPAGVPKLMVSSMAADDPSAFVGVPGLTLMYSVVDIAGVTGVSSRVLASAAAAIAGLATGYAAGRPGTAGGPPIVAATAAGATAPGVGAARELLDILGYDVLAFHGTAAYEAAAGGGRLAAALDATLLDLSAELLGGLRPAAPGRLTAAVRAGLPQVVAPGGLDMAEFAPGHEPGRRVHLVEDGAVLLRTTPLEAAELGRRVAARLRDAAAPTALHIPLRGLSALGAPGGPFHDPVADEALFTALREGLDGSLVEVREMDANLNDPAFGRAMADHLHTMITRVPVIRAAS